ncbi:MAG: hypothetical protein OXU75_09290 [Deltaproteobacteria bacterium]|nr:hypothetical protein [Deltaproteobacteria bacterium]
MSTYEIASLIIASAQAAAATGAAIGIWRGINQMAKASEQRSKREDQHHAEAMTALRALIERTAPHPDAAQ